jgi:hypothetical protein
MSNFFEDVNGISPYLKMGMFGTEGSGKTFSMALVAIGLHRRVKSQKPIVMWDSEGGSDYLHPLFAAAGIKFMAKKARSLLELGRAIPEAQSVSDILLIDSLTHPYQELLTAYRKKKKGGGYFIDMRDWGPIKDEWKERFAFKYVQSPLHIIWCARSKNLFEDVLDQEATERNNGQEKFKSVATGTGAKSETESAYEPSLLCEMEKVYASKQRKKSGAYKIRMLVHKDRTNFVMGRSFEYEIMNTKQAVEKCKPFADISPHVDYILSSKGKILEFSNETSEEIFDADDSAGKARFRRKKALETIESALKAIFGQGKDPLKSAALEKIYGVITVTELELKDYETLEAGIESLRDLYKYQQTDDLTSVDKVRSALEFLKKPANGEVAEQEAKLDTVMQ